MLMSGSEYSKSSENIWIWLTNLGYFWFKILRGSKFFEDINYINGNFYVLSLKIALVIESFERLYLYIRSDLLKYCLNN